MAKKRRMRRRGDRSGGRPRKKQVEPLTLKDAIHINRKVEKVFGKTS